MAHGWKISHRNTELAQPEVCQLTGTLVPAIDLIVSTVEGLRGVHVGSSYQWSARVRLRPSYNDIRRLNPGPPLTASQQKYLSGAALWWIGTNISEQETCIIPGPDGELIEVPNGGAGRTINTEDLDDITTEGNDEITEDLP